MPWGLAVTAFAPFFVLIDPAGNVPMFMALTNGMTEAERRGTAFRGVIAATVILIAVAFAGAPVLEALGVSLAAFRIAGGLLLLIIALDMVLVRQSGARSATADETEEASHKDDVAIVPLAVPLIAGPGAFASIILLMGQAGGAPSGVAAVLGALLAVLVILLVALLLASQIMRVMGVTGVNVVGRVFGIVLAAIALQLVIDGVAEAFPGLVA
jgi:multiple antibiotic resistance protein